MSVATHDFTVFLFVDFFLNCVSCVFYFNNTVNNTVLLVKSPIILFVENVSKTVFIACS